MYVGKRNGTLSASGAIQLLQCLTPSLQVQLYPQRRFCGKLSVLLTLARETMEAYPLPQHANMALMRAYVEFIGALVDVVAINPKMQGQLSEGLLPGAVGSALAEPHLVLLAQRCRRRSAAVQEPRCGKARLTAESPQGSQIEEPMHPEPAPSWVKGGVAAASHVKAECCLWLRGGGLSADYLGQTRRAAS